MVKKRLETSCGSGLSLDGRKRCEKCKNLAKYNIQYNSYWEGYFIDKNEEFKKVSEVFDRTVENFFLCKKHYDQYQDQPDRL